MKRKLFSLLYFTWRKVFAEISLFLFFTSRTSFSFCVLIKLPYNATETGPLLKCISKVKQFCFSLITGMIAMKIRKHQGLPIVSNKVLVSVSILHKKQQISDITEWSAWNEWKYQIEHVGAIEFESYKSNFEIWLEGSYQMDGTAYYCCTTWVRIVPMFIEVHIHLSRDPINQYA